LPVLLQLKIRRVIVRFRLAKADSKAKRKFEKAPAFLTNAFDRRAAPQPVAVVNTHLDVARVAGNELEDH
jgi:antitoxin component HigA of HigAB toxin-antitoxin module